MTTPSLPVVSTASLPLTSAMAATSIAFPRFLQLLNESVAAGAVANVTHTELKQHFSRLLEALWEKHVSAPYFYGQRDQGETPGELYDFYYGDTTALHRIEATLRKVDLCGIEHPAVDAMRQVLTEFVPIVQRLAVLKECIVKRPTKSQEEREAEHRFVPTPATPAATRHVWDVLTKVTERNERQLVEYITREYAKRLDFFMAASPTLRQKLIGNYENRAAVDAGTVPRHTPVEDYTLKPDFRTHLVALAQRDAIEMRDNFIAKVVSKIAPIVESKGNLAAVHEVRDTIQVGRLSGMLAIEFTDGARFLVDNNVVYSSSVRNRQFVRFPLTFHDVTLADGSRMKQPSEERMHSVFCVASAPAQDDQIDDDESDAGEPNVVSRG